jgi:hypothetical protein
VGHPLGDSLTIIGLDIGQKREPTALCVAETGLQAHAATPGGYRESLATKGFYVVAYR